MDPNASALPSPEPSFRIAGEGRELFTRTDLRNRIRAGHVTGETEISREESEEYFPARSFPELARYFAILSSAPSASSTPASESSAPPGSTRVLAGLIYPFTGIGWIILLVAAFLETVPFGTLVAGVFTTVYILAIVRASSRGVTTMPALSELGGPSQFALAWLKAIGVSIGSAWPVILAIPIMLVIPSPAVPLIALVLVVLYYPAAIAALARWNSLRLALTPSSIMRMISVLGFDYLIALGAFFVAVGGAVVAAVGVGMTISRSPAAVQSVATLFALWAIFYAYHLVGWAMYRHQHELE